MQNLHICAAEKARAMPTRVDMNILLLLLAKISGPSRPLLECVEDVRSSQEGRVSESHTVRRVLATMRMLLLEAPILIHKVQVDPGMAILVKHALPALLLLVRVLAETSERTLAHGRQHYGPAAWAARHENVLDLFDLAACPRFSTFDNTVKYISTPSSGSMGAIDRLLVNGSLTISDAALAAKPNAEIADVQPRDLSTSPLTVIAGRLAHSRTLEAAEPLHTRSSNPSLGLSDHVALPLAHALAACCLDCSGRRVATRTFMPSTEASVGQARSSGPSSSTDPLEAPTEEQAGPSATETPHPKRPRRA